MRIQDNLEYTFVVGDVHGCIDEFNSLLEQVSKDTAGLEHVHVISVGDLVDRGPDSHGVLRAWNDLPHKTLVIGNHESKAIRKGHTYRGDHDADIPGARKTEEPLTDELKAILATGKMWASFEVLNKSYLCLHGGLFPAWMRSHGTALANLPTDESSSSVKKRWQRTTMVRHIDLESGQMVGLGQETDATPYWAELYGNELNDFYGNWDFRILDRRDQLVTVLFGHQPHPGQPGYPYGPFAVPLDYGVPFGDQLVGLLFHEDFTAPKFYSQAAYQKYSLKLEEIQAMKQ